MQRDHARRHVVKIHMPKTRLLHQCLEFFLARVHADRLCQEELKALMKQSGFGHVDFHNMTAGVVALHVGIKC